MIAKYHKLVLAAGIALAMAFTFGCSSDDKSDDGNSERGGSNSGGNPGTNGGNNTQDSCPNAVISNNTVSCGGQTYKTVVIGDQTWMAENLNYNVANSKCYGEGGQVYDKESSDSIRTLSNAEIQANCVKYGRLYNWATAMVLPSSCNKSACLDQINTPHQGICPTGWHIPSFADWNKLYRIAYRTDSLDYAAGKRLKAKEGWNNCGSSGSSKIYSCDDTYGFKALPGGVGYSTGYFSEIGNRGYWWGWGTQDGNGEFNIRIMENSSESGIWSENFPNGSLVSVRCLKDD